MIKQTTYIILLFILLTNLSIRNHYHEGKKLYINTKKTKGCGDNINNSLFIQIYIMQVQSKYCTLLLQI